jgi:tRNA1(Val) A37 N6-methylase TrmN6
MLLNHLEDRMSILQQDLRELGKTSLLVLSMSSSPIHCIENIGAEGSTLPWKAIARHEMRRSKTDLRRLLLPAMGICYVIFPATRTVDFLVALRNRKLEPKRLQFVHPRIGEDAKFILAESIKTSGVELKVTAPLILEE